MAMKIEIVSKETIKPWKQTETKPYKLCLLDQLSPSFYIPLVLFYKKPDQHPIISVVESLKSSLSETLSTFYPLAKEKINDQEQTSGVVFVEARLESSLLTILESPDMCVVQKLLPIDPYGSGEGYPAIAMQLNTFRCGGTALGICAHHKIVDGTALVSFLESWAKICVSNGSVSPPKPSLNAAEIFPPREVEAEVDARSLMDSQGQVVARRFRFTPSALSRLKSEASSDNNTSPTRVEAVTALLTIVAETTRTMKSKPVLVTQVVNLRARTSPPLPSNTFGNLWRCAAAMWVPQDHGLSLSHVAARLREEVRKLDGDYCEMLKTSEGFQRVCAEIRGAAELVMSPDSGLMFLKFSSWIRFPIYEVDFGFGAPVWACVTAVPIEGSVILMSDKSGDGVEAWVNLEENHMARFQTNSELLKFAFLAPGS